MDHSHGTSATFWLITVLNTLFFFFLPSGNFLDKLFLRFLHLIMSCQWRKNRRGAESTLPKRSATLRAHVFNLFPGGIFIRCCLSLNDLTGSKSRVSNCCSLNPLASAAMQKLHVLSAPHSPSHPACRLSSFAHES